MEKDTLMMAQQVAKVAGAFQQQMTGHPPKVVAVVLSGDTLVITLHDALTPAEQALSKSAEGAAKVQEFHRRLFANSVAPLRQEIRKITGMDVSEAASEIETASGTVVHAFTNGTVVQVFLLAESALEGAKSGKEEGAK